MDHESPLTRPQWIAVLARATAAETAALAALVGDVAFTRLKPAETGTLMVEARAGGSGRRFHLGEATMTKATVRLAHGRVGFAAALGRDRARVEQAAVIDAVLQDTPTDAPLLRAVAALAAEQRARAEMASRKAAATRVNFFSLVRGDG